MRTTSTESSIQLLPVAMVTESCLLGVLCASRYSLQSNSTIHAYMHSAYWHPAALQVYQVAFWLMKYGSPSPKRLMLRSNWHDIMHMDLGRLPREQAAAQTTVKTSRLGPNMHLHNACIHACSMIEAVMALIKRSGVVRKLSNKHSASLSHSYSCMHYPCMHMCVQGLSASLWRTPGTNLDRVKAGRRTFGKSQVCINEKHIYACICICTCRRPPSPVRGLSDREIFERMPTGDPWNDADLYTVFCYLYHSKSTVVPDSWVECMAQFAHEFGELVVADPALIEEYNELTSSSRG